MKRLILTTLVFTVLLSACKNKPEHEKIETNIEKSSDSQNHSETDKDNINNPNEESNTYGYIYKSTNGDNLDVTFFDKNDKQFVKIEIPNKEDLVLEQTSALAKGATYENENYKWSSQNDDATLMDGTKTMELVLLSPLQYTYTNTKESIRVIYFDRGDKRFVTLKKENKPEQTLEQTTAWAKGAEYGKKDIQWHTQRNEGTWIENGKETKFIRKGK